jgi:hypothetical protein
MGRFHDTKEDPLPLQNAPKGAGKQLLRLNPGTLVAAQLVLVTVLLWS